MICAPGVRITYNPDGSMTQQVGNEPPVTFSKEYLEKFNALENEKMINYTEDPRDFPLRSE